MERLQRRVPGATLRDAAPAAGRRLAAAFLLAIIAFTGPATANERGGKPGAFDFYVLALSWSPSYCAAEGADANPDQCGTGRPYAFIVHGLWPQHERGYPEFCPIRGSTRVPDRLADEYRDLIPSAGLAGHQWRKHGSCSGLSQEDYFALVRKARGHIEIPKEFALLDTARTVAPEDVEQRFITANPGLAATGIAVTCDRSRLREVRICLTRDLEFRPCPEVDRRSCRKQSVLMPPVR